LGLRIEASGLILGAFALLLLPPAWVFSAVAAMAVHELGHYACARMLDIPVRAVRVWAGGCRMETGPMTQLQEGLCAGAGPIASLMLACFCKQLPLIGLCGLVQGLYNLLPVFPMDGGRILRAAAGERASVMVSFITTVILAGMGFRLTCFRNMGPIPLVFGTILLVKSKNFLQTGQTHSTIGLPIFKR